MRFHHSIAAVAAALLLLATLACAQQAAFTPQILQFGGGTNNLNNVQYEAGVLSANGYILIQMDKARVLDRYDLAYPDLPSDTKINATQYMNRFANNQVSSWSTVSVGDTVYSVTPTSILATNFTEPATSGSFNIPSVTSSGVFSYTGGADTKVFILDAPSNQVHYFVAQPNSVVIDGNISLPLSSINVADLDPNTWSFALDSKNGLAFIGDALGGVATLDLKTLKTVGSKYINATITKRSTGTVDSDNHLVFFCAEENGQVVMDVLQYQIPFTGLTRNYTTFLTRMSACTAAAYDSQQGQVFFIGADLDGLAVIGEPFREPVSLNGTTSSFDLNTNFISFFYDQEITVDATAIGFSHDQTKKQLTVFTAKQYIQMSYISICKDNCNGNGDCVMGTCHCNAEFVGDFCENKLCLGDLNNCTSGLHGNCNNGICECDPFYQTVANCSVLGCKMNCSSRGECHFDSVAKNYTCQCPPDFVGEYCQSSAPAPKCDEFASRSACIDRTYCGWCASTKTCQAGNQYGPAMGFCREWFFEEDYEVGVIVLACIFIALISILFLIDMITTIPLDFQRAKNYEVEFRTGTYPKPSHEEASVLWWRDQRSAKAWTLMDQFQFLSLVSHMGVVFPSRFLSFTMFLDWTNLGIPFPESIREKMPEYDFSWRDTYDQVSSTPARSLLTYAQYNNILESGSTYHLANILFWFIILAAAFIVPLLLAFIILNFIESLVHWKEVIRNRLVHCTIRILQFSYIGVISAAAFSIVAKPIAAKTLVPGVILLVLYGIGFPLAIWFILRVPESRLHNPTFKQQFGSLYVNFKPKTDHRFVVFSYVKRFIMAVIIGILAFDIEPSYPLSGTDRAVPIAQCAVISVVLLLYAVLLFIRKPYFDHYHLWLEYILAVINIVSICVCLTHLKSPSQAGELVFCILQALGMVVCIATFVISWLQMRSKFLNKITSCFSCCGGSSKTVDHEMTGHRK